MFDYAAFGRTPYGYADNPVTTNTSNWKPEDIVIVRTLPSPVQIFLKS